MNSQAAIDLINNNSMEMMGMNIAIQELKYPTIGQKRFVSQFWLSSVHDHAGKDILKRFLEENEVGFINNKGENCELYLKKINLL